MVWAERDIYEGSYLPDHALILVLHDSEEYDDFVPILVDGARGMVDAHWWRDKSFVRIG